MTTTFHERITHMDCAESQRHVLLRHVARGNQRVHDQPKEYRVAAKKKIKKAVKRP